MFTFHVGQRQATWITENLRYAPQQPASKTAGRQVPKAYQRIPGERLPPFEHHDNRNIVTMNITDNLFAVIKFLYVGNRPAFDEIALIVISVGEGHHHVDFSVAVTINDR